MKMRNIEKLIIHCSATREGDDSINAKVIDRWHRSRGWSGIGYHFCVLIDGTIEYGRDLNKIGAHTKGQNTGSIGVCYVGGVEKDGKTPKDTRTTEQKESLLLLINTFKRLHPGLTIHGHREFSNKACPSFNCKDEYNEN
jgi:N-acetylmuramoyl-L-alanine amidase